MGWHRRRYWGRNLERAVSIADLRERAHAARARVCV